MDGIERTSSSPGLPAMERGAEGLDRCPSQERRGISPQGVAAFLERAYSDGTDKSENAIIP